MPPLNVNVSTSKLSQGRARGCRQTGHRHQHRGIVEYVAAMWIIIVLSAGSPSDLNYNYELKAHANLDRLALPLDLLPGRGCLSPAAVLVEFPPSCMHRVCEGEGDEYKI